MACLMGTCASHSCMPRNFMIGSLAQFQHPVCLSSRQANNTCCCTTGGVPFETGHFPQRRAPKLCSSSSSSRLAW